MVATGLQYIHLTMPVGGEARARAFYGELLGMAEIATPASPARRSIRFQKLTLHLQLGVAPEWPATAGHAKVPVQDLRRTVDSLVKAGYQAQFSPGSLSGFDRAFATDPFGNLIELVKMHSPPAAGRR